MILQVPDEESLLDWADAVHLSGQPYLVVHEPDIDEHTVLVIGPGPFHVKLANLPLAGKELAMT